MKILSIETSTRNFSLAVSDGAVIRAARDIELKQVLSDSIMPAIDRILKEAGTSLRQLDGFAVGLGPGSFTSLRVGISTVKALSFALQKPVAGVPSLDTIALRQEEHPDKPICVASDARRGLLYSCFYQKKDGRLQRKTKYLLIAPQELLKKIKKDTLFAGDGVKIIQGELLKRDRERAGKNAWTPFFAQERYGHPSARYLAVLAWQRFKQKKIKGIEKLVPLYLYPDDCQVKR